jgi:hypothetical protein
MKHEPGFTQPKKAVRLLISLLMAFVFLGVPQSSHARLYAQEPAPSGVVQRIDGRLEPGAPTLVYLLEGLQAGDTLYVTMNTLSGNLDPIVAVLDGAIDYAAVEAQYNAELQRLLSADGEVSLNLNTLRDRTFLSWDDDGGEGYGAALEFPIPAAGDYFLIAGSSLSAAGHPTAGDYSLVIGINEPGVLDGSARPTGETLAILDREVEGLAASVSEVSGELSANQSVAVLELIDIDPEDKLYVFVEATSGNLRPEVVLRDYGDKPLAATNLGGQETSAILEFVFPEESIDYSLKISGAPGDGGQPTTGEFRAVVGLNAPEVLTGQAAATDRPALKSPIEVQVGVKIDRISEVDSAGEDFTVIGSVRLDWQDPNLAFSPDSCDCDVKFYSEKEFDRFLADSDSRWPDFAFFNQQGNRWVQNRVAAVWPDGRARYSERFTTIFQSDFDFHKFPFDVQPFPIIVDMILPASEYILTPLPGYSAINPDHGEDEFIIGELTSTPDTVASNAAADQPVSRMTFSFEAPRHQDYYILQVFVPVLLIVAISWFTFFLKDFTRRIEASAANVLLFIAFSFSLSENYPRLGYITFLDALMAVAFIVNALVLLYNVQMKRMETNGELERVQRFDDFFDWAYPLLYVVSVIVVIFLFFGRG